MKSLSTALSVVALLPEPLAANATLIDPVPYSSFAGSPSARALFDYFELEHPEDCLSNVSDGLAPHGVASRSASRGDWINADRSPPNGSGASGHTWYFNGVSSITFTFSTALLGALPNHAGLIWTDLGLANVRKGFDSILFEAFDTAHNLLGIIGPSALGDGLFAGQTAEDRFFGVTSASGIGSVRISLLHSTEQGLDNLQYDLAKLMPFSADPDPANTLAVLVVGRAGDGFTRRHLQG
ncbi:hypothetical protein [Nitrosospira sp. NpAV]|uniref:hypothetical protein n=1 Tax=Nitrosospira sp. NpAV TaxID=58133 RepID=UPI0012EC4FF5|nr:hypothetical protein [Nitrosospira sp. NpAV]